jgi:hypothetical protein
MTMSIDPTDKIHSMTPPTKMTSPPDKPPQPSGIEFSKVLEKNVRDAQAQPIVSQKPVSQVIGPCCCLSQNQVRLEAYERAVRTLDAMDRYKKLLADEKANLRDMQPAVADMKKETELIKTTLEQLPEDDNLKKILGETLLIASKEIARFNMGYYAD